MGLALKKKYLSMLHLFTKEKEKKKNTQHHILPYPAVAMCRLLVQRSLKAPYGHDAIRIIDINVIKIKKC